MPNWQLKNIEKQAQKLQRELEIGLIMFWRIILPQNNVPLVMKIEEYFVKLNISNYANKNPVIVWIKGSGERQLYQKDLSFNIDD